MDRRSIALVTVATRVSTRGRVALALFAVLLFCAPLLSGQSANGFFKRGVTAESREDYDNAFINYQKAVAKAPKDLQFRTALYRVRVNASSLHIAKGRRLLSAGDRNGALTEFMRAHAIDPGNESAQQAIDQTRNLLGTALPRTETSLPEMTQRVDDMDHMGAPVDLHAVSSEPLTLKMTEDTKRIYQALGKAAGINILFDPDYTSKRVEVDLNNVSLLDALRIVGTLSGTFWRPVTSNTIFVATNTATKRKELDEQAVQTFYLTNAWQANDLTDVQTAMRNVLPNLKVAAVASQNAIVVRGTPDELMLAGKLVNDLDKARPEVVVDVAILEVSKNWERNIGISWPASIGFQLQPLTSTTTPVTPTGGGVTPAPTTSSSLTLSNLGALNSGNIAVSVSSATANLLLTDSNTRILQNPRIRSSDMQKATMKIGSRIPIATGSYGGGGGGLGGGLGGGMSSLVNTQFQYQDVGVNIEMTPTVHFDHDVTLKMKIEVTAQSGSVTISDITEPILSQRTTEGVIRLREGEASILGGILNRQDSVSFSGIPGLSSIPLIKYLFGSKDRKTTDDEIVFLLVPHIVRSQELTPTNLRMIDTGAGQTSIELRHLSHDKLPVTGNEIPAVRPVVKAAPKFVDTVPGQSAQAAAPGALSQLRGTLDIPPVTTAPPIAGVPSGTVPPPPAGSAAAAPVPATPNQAAGNGPSFSLVAPRTTVTVGSTFQIPVQLNNVEGLGSVPVQVQYDSARLSLENVNYGDLLGKDGQAVSLVHRDDGAGMVTIVVSRPPNAVGVSGSGSVCILSFKAKSAGSAQLTIAKPGAMDASSRPIEVKGAQTSITVQ